MNIRLSQFHHSLNRYVAPTFSWELSSAKCRSSVAIHWIMKLFKLTILSIIIISFIVMIFLLPKTMTYAASSNYIDFSDQHTYPNELLEELIHVYSYDEDYDKAKMQREIDNLVVIPERLFEIMKNEEAEILFVDFPVSDIKGLEYLDEEEPLGYPEGSTYRDDVFGVAAFRDKGASISAVTRIDDSRELEISLHELGHVVHAIIELGDLEFNVDELLPLHDAEFKSLFPASEYGAYWEDNYYSDSREFFAEAFSFYYLGGDKKKNLRETAPKTFSLIDNIIDRMIKVTENSIEKVSLSWIALDDAVSYDIFRDDEHIASVEDTTFEDPNFSSPFHTYEVMAVDETGEVISNLFKKSVSTKSYERSVLELEEKADQESKAWEKEMESRFTVEDAFNKIGIPFSYFPIIFYTVLAIVFVGFIGGMGWVIYRLAFKKSKMKLTNDDIGTKKKEVK